MSRITITATVLGTLGLLGLVVAQEVIDDPAPIKPQLQQAAPVPLPDNDTGPYDEDSFTIDVADDAVRTPAAEDFSIPEPSHDADDLLPALSGADEFNELPADIGLIRSFHDPVLVPADPERGSSSSPQDDVAAITDRIQQLAEQWRRAAGRQSGSKQRNAIIAALRQELQRLFDAHTIVRSDRIRSLENRIRTLRSQLDEREQRKREIVELRLRTILNEATGLTF